MGLRLAAFLVMSLTVLAKLFFKLGVVGFGGPAAHIAMMEDEVVTRREWLTRQHFLDLVGATNLIPGPNSTEMTMHVGYTMGGLPGLVVAGASFILPAALLTGLLAWFYVRFGSLPEVAPFLAGIQPVVLVIILGALWRLGRKAANTWQLATIGLAVAGATLLGLNEVLALFAGGILGALWLHWRGSGAAALLLLPGVSLPVTLPSLFQTAAPTLWQLGLFFLLIGSILYGSGYVLVAFLEGWLVNDFAWLTQQQLLDAIAIGQFTPGPVLTTATFIGYLLGGVPGAVVATIAIFMPSFVFVALLNPWVPRLRNSTWASAFLDAVNVSAVGLMMAVLLRLASVTLVTPAAWLIALVAALLLFRWQISAPVLVVAGAVVGWLLQLL